MLEVITRSRRRVVLTTCALTVAALAGTTGAALAVTGNLGGKACVSKDDGSVRFVARKSTRCGGDERAVAWSGAVKGQTGATGRQGATGKDGATGATGPAGTAGATGPTGPVGARGPAGAPGTPGAPGAPGADGADGVGGWEYRSAQVMPGDSVFVPCSGPTKVAISGGAFTSGQPIESRATVQGGISGWLIVMPAGTNSTIYGNAVCVDETP